MNTEKQLALVTFEQAKRLKNAVFDWEVSDYFDNTGLLNPCIKAYSEFPAPTIALALKWFRDVKNIQCGITCCESICGRKLFYVAKWQTNEFTYKTLKFDTYELAESALLDELLTLIENK